MFRNTDCEDGRVRFANLLASSPCGEKSMSRFVLSHRRNLLIKVALQCPRKMESESTPFHMHFIVRQEGVRDAQTAYPQAALSGAIS